MKLQPGDRLDRFTLIKLLGATGEGSVWMVSDALAPSQTRTLKLLSVRDTSPAAVERIRREARAVATVSHPSLVQVHTLFEDLRQRLMGMVMDYVDGTSLADALGDPRLTIRLREHALGHIMRALASMHEQGLAHRDFKLSNVILARDFWQSPERPENVKVVDYGIAMAVESKERLADIGVAAYLAPEVISRSSETSPQSADVFAFGVVGWYLLTANHPTGLPHEATLADYAQAYASAREQGRVFAPNGYRGVWATVLEACTLLDPAERPLDCQGVVLLLGQGATPDRKSRPSLPRTSTPPHPLLAPGQGAEPPPIPPHGYPLPPAKAPRRIRFGYLTIGIVMVAAVLIAAALGFSALR